MDEKDRAQKVIDDARKIDVPPVILAKDILSVIYIFFFNIFRLIQI